MNKSDPIFCCNSISNHISEALNLADSYHDSSFEKKLDNICTALILSSPQGNILYANKTACQLFGYTNDQLKNILWENFISSNEYKFQEKLHAWRFSKLTKEKVAELKITGTSYSNEFKTSLLTDAAGSLINLIIFQDPCEANLLYNELCLLTNNSEEAFLLLNKELNIVSYNRESTRLFKLLIDKPLKKAASIFEYAQPERIEILKQLYARILNGQSESAKISFTDNNEDQIIFNIKYNPAYDQNEMVSGVFISFTNVTKEEINLAELHQTQETLRKIMDSSLDIICTVTREGKYIQISAAAEKLWGYKTEDIIGKHYSEFVTRDYIAPTVEVASKVIAGIALSNYENRISDINGNIVYMEWSANWDKKAGLMFCVGRDITEKKLGALKLLQSEQRFKRLVQDGSDLVGIMDDDGNYSYVSPTSLPILGYKPEDLVGKNAFDYVHPEDLERLKDEFASIANSNKLFIAPFRFLHNNGDWRWIETSLTNLKNEPFVNGYVVNSRDITERVKSEADIKFNAELLNTIGQAAIATELNGIVTYWNKAAETIYGYSREEAMGKNIMDLTPAPGSLERSSGIMEKISKGQSWSGEFLVKKKNGTIFPVMVTSTPILDLHGNVSGIIGISSDITERKIAERELELANERHNLILKATSDVVWDWNLETDKVIRSAENMKKLFGYDLEDDIHNASFWKNNVHPEEQEQISLLFENFINNSDKNYVDCEYRFRTANGSYAHVHDKGFAIRNKEGKAVRMIGSVQDVSYIKREEIKLKLINEELVQQAKELAFSNRELEQFAYVASHDLQEPLRMVSSFLTQIEKKYEPLLDEKGKRYIHFAVDGAKRMRQIILDLLEYSRAGNKEDKLEDVNLELILKEIKALLRRKIKDKHATITSDPLPVINAHISPMRQVFQNLITNALLYCRVGVAPVIHLNVKDRETHWQFEVRDNGLGISENYFEKVFVIFQRLPSKETFEGSGVGLAVTKKIIDNYGGSIWLESTLGEGSSFYFTILK